MNESFMPRYSARDIAALLGGPAPTDEQVAVIEAPLTHLLVVAGAGSGKTETMTARVVYLVANALVSPHEILGLTFTRKAAGELSSRVQERLRGLHSQGVIVLELDEPATIGTYHSYAGRLVREHGLLLGVEADAQLLTEATAWQLAHEVVLSYDGPMGAVTRKEGAVTQAVVALAGELAEHLLEPSDVSGFIERWCASVGANAEPPRGRLRECLSDLRQRQAVLAIVERFRQAKTQRGVLDFGDQVALAARLAETVPHVAAQESARYRVVLLDEFQDTSHAQLVLMRSLFANAPTPVAVTAVGDPNQSIYAWRGASATTLRAFPADFPVAGQPAPRCALRTSWRNGVAILSVANAVAGPLRVAAAGAPGVVVPVPELQAAPQAGKGVVEVARLSDLHAEADAVAEWIERHRGPASAPRSGAVLCRKRSQFAAIIAGLERRALPYEVVGLGGLLLTSEVADLLALLQIVADPTRGDALMRLLTGPPVRLGAADLDGLWAWARSRVLPGSATGHVPPGNEPGSLPDLETASADDAVLLDAVLQLPPPDWRDHDGRRVSPLARARLAELAEQIDATRALTGLPLPDLIGRAETVLRLDVEVLARPGWKPASARAHLDAFSDVAADYANGTERATLAGFLGWVESAIENERGLEQSAADPTPQAVQVLTVHAAKGLEWDLVAVPSMAEGTFPAFPSGAAAVRPQHDRWKVNTPTDKTWTAGLDAVPYPLRGDRAGLPELANLQQLDGPARNRALEDFALAGGSHAMEQERRLAYVACTRARSRLLLTTAVWGTQQAPRVVSRFLRELLPAQWCADLAPLDGSEPSVAQRSAAVGPDSRVERAEGITRRTWEPMPDVTGQVVNPVQEQVATVWWPTVDLDPARNRLRATAHSITSGTVAPITDPLLQDQLRLLLRESLTPPARSVMRPDHLSASQVVASARDLAAYRRWQQRPIPQRPDPRARIGSTFHAWVEQHYGAPAIIDLDDLPGSADQVLDAATLSRLQETFRASLWATCTPLEVELSVEAVVAGTPIRGRIDAVFADPRSGARSGALVVVDWKTGLPPTGSRATAQVVQLSLYALSYARLMDLDPSLVSGAFYFAANGHTQWRELLSEAQLQPLVAAASLP